MRFFLTGGAGFIGSHLGEALLARGDHVHCLDNFDAFYARALKEANLRVALGAERFRFTEGDIRDGELLGRLLAAERPDAVLHLGARGGVRPSVQDPLGYLSINVVGTAVLLEACREAGVRKVLFASSSSVYGDDSPAPFREDACCNRPASPYAATKKACEETLHGIHKVAEVDAVCLRYFTVYGPRQRPDMAIHSFARDLAAGRTLTLYDGGRLQRDFTYVADAVTATLAALDFLLTNQPTFEVFNVGTSRWVTLERLVEILGRALDRRPAVRFDRRPAGDIKRTWADVSKARELLGYEPRVDIEEGIQRFAEWFVSEGLPAQAAPAQRVRTGAGA